jgi:hypothetical protein
MLCYDAQMSDLDQSIQARRAIEDRLIQLGNERDELTRKTSENIQAITDAMAVAVDAGIPIEYIAQLVRVSRQTLYRWKEGAIRMT